MTFVTQPFIGQELFEHVSSSYEGFENCAQCGRKFDNKRELNGHIFLVHEGKKVYRCPICKVALLKLVNRRGLLNIKSEQKTCEGCVRNLIKNRGLKGHFHLCISLSTTGNYVFKHFSRIPFWSQNLQGMKSNHVLMKFVDMFF